MKKKASKADTPKKQLHKVRLLQLNDFFSQKEYG